MQLTITTTTALAFPLAILACWMYIERVRQGGQQFPRLQGKRICLLIAHPDDEAMFFAPTVLALTEPLLRNHVRILCLSSGNADGLGETRKRELVRSGLLLGLRGEDDVFVVEDEKFPDSMTSNWEPSHISDVLTRTFVRNATKKATAQPPSPTTIDVLITFDRHGVSSHPNHRALYHGALHFIDTLTKPHPGWRCPVALYTLTSISWIRKYASILDSVITILQMIVFRKKSLDPPTPLLLVSSFSQFRRAQTAMIRAHKSQMRWFRWGWIVLSRYMIVNDLKLEKMD